MLPLAFRLAIAGLVLVGLGPIGTRIGLWRFTIGLQLMGLGWLIALIALLIALVGGIRSRDWDQAGVAIAVGLIAVTVPLSQLLKGRGAPPIHDISTDMQEPPVFQALLSLRTGDVSPAAYDGDATAVQQQASYDDIGPVHVPGPSGEAFARALQSARDLGWTVVASDAAAGRIEATDTT